ncbi:MAG: hypothetical protein KC420_07000 [Myxococcales bacterium]|nr:hypothetical protein [Myxococcales bacterium]MCB9702176.1 hypothetical protein [Myxococcales bacterium]
MAEETDAKNGEGAGAGIDPALLDRLRRGFPLRLDRLGAFWIGDEPVTHPRVIDALRRGLDLSESGEVTVHLGPQWCYLRVDDCPLRVLGVREGERDGEAAPAASEAPTLDLLLDDGRRLPLDPATLWEEPGEGLRCAVPAARSGRPLAARFTNRGQIELAEWLDLEAEPRPLLRLGGRRWVINEVAPAGSGDDPDDPPAA